MTGASSIDDRLSSGSLRGLVSLECKRRVLLRLSLVREPLSVLLVDKSVIVLSHHLRCNI